MNGVARHINRIGWRFGRLALLILLALVALPAAPAAAQPTGAAIVSERVSFASAGTSLVGYLFRPAGAAGTSPGPTIVMAHGLGLTQSSGLRPYAERFAAAGARVLTFDYRGFGESDGTPRQLIDPWAQLDDWRAAIGWARDQSWTDTDRVILWGSSFSGGHVLELGARDPSPAAVVSQVPHVNGALSSLAADIRSVPALGLTSAADTAAGAAGLPRVTIPLVGPPGSVALMTQPGTMEGYLGLIGNNPQWVNAVPASIVLQMPFYSPDVVAAASSVPTYIGVAADDAVTPAPPAIALAHRMGADLHVYPGGHFDVYTGAPFERVITDQLAFLAPFLNAA